MLRELGASIVDADVIAREVVAPKTAGLAAVVDHFGTDVLAQDGSLDRKKLGALVFADDDARAALNRITHPRIAVASQAQIAAHTSAGAPLVIYEAALLVEARRHHGMRGLIVVTVPTDIQLQRLMARDHIDAEAARARIQSQLALHEKVKLADFVIDNSGSRDATSAQVQALWTRLTAPGTG